MDNLVNNYYLLKHWAPFLSDELNGSTLVEVFGQSQRETVFQFATDTDHHSLTFFLGHNISFTFLDRKAKPKGGVPEFFKTAIGNEVNEAHVFNNDRSFYIQLTNDFCFVFKMYGGHGNIILYQNDTAIDLLRKNLKKDWETAPHQFHQHIQQDFQAFDEALSKKSDAYEAVKNLFPTFTSDFFTYLDQNGFAHKNPEAQWELIETLLAAFNTPTFYLHKALSPKEKKDPGWRLSLFQGNAYEQAFASISEAMQVFARNYLKDFQSLLLRQNLLDYWDKEQKKVEKRINNHNKHLQKLIEGYDYKTLADILMANMHEINKGQESAKLYDFYNDNYVTIPLKKDQSPQENAERYYRKGKHQNLELEHVESNLEAEKEKLTDVEAMLESIRAETDMKRLQKLYKATFNPQKGKKSQKTDLAHKFKHFDLEGFDVYAGKGAKTNDLLTFQFANKNDLWLHAREQTGSHIIVRNSGQDNFPDSIIEKAGGLAAYYSKGKGQSLCPVIYTRKKYVWKPKGYDPGQVNYKNESLIMVEPTGPE